MRLVHYFAFFLISPLLISTWADELLVPDAQIYVPSPQFKDLNRPTAQIMDLPPIRPIYGTPGISTPGQFSHYQYLYFRPYNYRMQNYPYMAYQGNGRRNPGYFPWNGKPRKTEPRSQRFEGAQILHAPSKVEQTVEGQIEGPKFLTYWLQAVGLKRTPPMVGKGQMAAFLNTERKKAPRLIQKVEAIEKDGKIVKLEIRFQSQSKSEEKPSFYRSSEDTTSKGFLSVAIFKDLKVPVKFIDITKKEETEDEDPEKEERDPSEFLGAGRINCKITDLTKFRPASTGGALNTATQDSDDLEGIKKYLDLAKSRVRTLANVDFKREVVYITGRAYTTREKALEIYDRKILKVSDLGSRRIRHLVEIEETSESKEENNLRTAPKDDEFWFSGHFVVVEKPKEYSGYRFGVTMRNTPREDEEED
ncbi:hypothetical protein HOF92_05230 [bacterium]|jgi:hypothetical protein|nr:hypothetical protein [bacterium]